MHISLRRYLAILSIYLQPQWFKVLLVTLLLLANIGFDLYNPQIIKIFIDTVTLGGETRTLLILALFFVAIAVVSQFFSVISSYLSTKVAWTATNHLRHDLMAHSLMLDMSYHKEHTPGEMIERIDGDVSQLANFFSNFIVNVTNHSLLLIGVLVLLYTVSWLIGSTMTVYVLLSFAFLTYIRRRTMAVWKQNREMSATFYSFIEERLQGTEDIRANGATQYLLRRFLVLARNWRPIILRAGWAGNYLYGGAQLLFLLGTVMMLGLGAYLWSIHHISVGAVFLLFVYSNQLNYPIQQIQSQFQDLQQAQASLKRVDEILNTISALPDGPGVPLPEGPLAVAFNHVTFGYVKDKPVLHDLSFEQKPGSVLGVLGRTGSGKTTLARLLFRLYDVQQGEVCIGGVPVKQAKLTDLRHHIGMVTQDVQIFHASVRDNLTFFDRSIPDTRILETLEDVGLYAWYSNLDDGLDTMLGAEGVGLSAGESQLLAFTRVFLAQPGLVILDEASSRLDPATEHLIEHAVNKLLTNCTAIIIAHRLTTVQRANDILVLEDGRILEYGSRSTLANDPSSNFSYLLKIGLEEALHDG